MKKMVDGIEIQEVTKSEQKEFVKESLEVLDSQGSAKEPALESSDMDLPDWMKYIGDDRYKVTTRKRSYIMEDIEYEQIMRAKARATGGKTTSGAMDNFEIALLSVSIIEPKMNEMNVRKLKGSEYMRLRAALYKLYDMESFL